ASPRGSLHLAGSRLDEQRHARRRRREVLADLLADVAVGLRVLVGASSEEGLVLDHALRDVQALLDIREDLLGLGQVAVVEVDAALLEALGREARQDRAAGGGADYGAAGLELLLGSRDIVLEAADVALEALELDLRARDVALARVDLGLDGPDQLLGALDLEF